MAEVRPFRGLRYNPSVVGDLAAVLCQPYDVISPEEQERLYRRHPNNVVRLELGRDDSPGGKDRYAVAAELLNQWRQDNVLFREPASAFYLTRHHFPWRGQTLMRTELTAAVRLEPLGSGSIKPHEDTRSGPKEDRLRLMLATRANVSPVMLLYRDPSTVKRLLDRAAASCQPLIAALGGGERLETWPVTEPSIVNAIREALAPEPLYIADGHHRYETALAYRDRVAPRHAPACGDHACDYVMAALIAFSDPGLLSLPYHRLLGRLDAGALARVRQRLESVCTEERHSMPGAKPEQVAEAALASLTQSDAVFEAWGLAPGVRSTLRLRDPAQLKAVAGRGRPPASAGLSTTLFREAVLKPALGVEEEEAERRGWLTFAKDAAEGIARVSAGERQLLLMPRPVPMDALKEVSDGGERLPPKSTYFHPKLLTGVVINPLDGRI